MYAVVKFVDHNNDRGVFPVIWLSNTAINNKVVTLSHPPESYPDTRLHKAILDSQSCEDYWTEYNVIVMKIFKTYKVAKDFELCSLDTSGAETEASKGTRSSRHIKKISSDEESILKRRKNIQKSRKYNKKLKTNDANKTQTFNTSTQRVISRYPGHPGKPTADYAVLPLLIQKSRSDQDGTSDVAAI